MSAQVKDYTVPGRASPSFLAQKNTRAGEIYEESVQWQLPSQRELLFLWTIQGSGKSGVYGLDLQKAIVECSEGNESVSHGTLYSILKRLRQKGWVDSYEGDPLGGGAKRQYYFLSEEGNKILAKVSRFLDNLQRWKPRYD